MRAIGAPGEGRDVSDDPSTIDEMAATQLGMQVMMYGLNQAMFMMGYLGHKLGLYEAMRGKGPSTAGEVAERAELHERWTLEWLRCQAAAGLIDSDGADRFELTPTQAAVVVDESSPFYGGGAWAQLERNVQRLPGLLESFRSGVGVPLWEGADPAQFPAMFEEFQRNMLVPAILPAMDGAVEALRGGGSFVDVGCGRGTALLTVAEAFPAAKIHGWDPWSEALEWGRERAAERSITNVEWHTASVLDLPADGRFDVALMSDCLHHMPDPVAALRAVKGALASDGVLIVIELRVDAIRAMPAVAAPAYALSIEACLNDGMAEDGSAGLGPMDFDQATVRALAKEAGFTSFGVIPVDHWVNIAYELRP